MTLIDGDVFYANNVLQVSEVYTGTGFNSSSGVAASHDFAVAAGAVGAYVQINITLSFTGDYHKTGGGADVIAIPQIKVGTSTADTAVIGYYSLPYNTSWANTTGAPYGGIATLTFFYAPSAGEKAAGFSVRITSVVSSIAGGGTGSVSNIQTTILTL